jgi:hypothetical protein
MSNRSTSPACSVVPRRRLRRVRELPVAGEVFGQQGQAVAITDVVARADLPGPLHPVSAAAALGVPRADLGKQMTVGEGTAVDAGQVIAESKALFGLLRSQLRSPIDGVVESISATTGQVLIRSAPEPVELRAYLPGRIVEVRPGVGVTVEAEVAMAQGIFGLGGEEFGELVLAADGPGGVLDEDQISAAYRDAIVLGRGRVTLRALERMRALGVRGAVTGSARGEDLIALVGGRLNPAATGDEDLGLTLVLTEGFGDLAMAERAYDLLAALAGGPVSISGTTQVRAGVIRPEVIGPPLAGHDAGVGDPAADTGQRVRIVRGDRFGAIGRVVATPAEPQLLGSGAIAAVLEVELDDGSAAIVPRANVEPVE